jgi:hypothetical protein
MTIVKMAGLIAALIISVSAIIGYLSTAIQFVDLSQSVMSEDIEEATSAIANFTETQVRDEVKSIVRGIYLTIALEFAAIFGSVAAAILALFKR